MEEINNGRIPSDPPFDAIASGSPQVVSGLKGRNAHHLCERFGL